MLPATSSVALEELGWSSFQDLAVAYAEDFFDARFISFAKGQDGGSDGQRTVFRPADEPSYRLMLQAKHSSVVSTLTVSEFEPDLAKMPALAADGFRAYVLVTNLTVTRRTEALLRSRALLE